jgi:hypothetical protein
MSRRISVLVAVTALAVSSFAYAADRTTKRERKQEKTQQETTAQAHPQSDVATKAAEATPAPATLEATFAVSADAKSIETEDGVSAAVGPIEVVVAKIGPDGKPVMACVDNIEAARRFLKAPAEQQAPKQAKEQ